MGTTGRVTVTLSADLVEVWAHPETTGLDAGLADWTSDLPDDEGLVALTGGTAVRWIEGQGPRSKTAVSVQTQETLVA